MESKEAETLLPATKEIKHPLHHRTEETQSQVEVFDDVTWHDHFLIAEEEMIPDLIT